MKLALNTYVYEVAKWPIEKTLKSARRLGFQYTEYAACGSGDPTSMSARKRREVVKMHRDLGLVQLADAAGQCRAHGLSQRQDPSGRCWIT